ncbi:MAG: hypothetical protein JJ992_23390, partial [Planctomycetes bacterium]|nr:hypothetical protein [Planctomycetota bacterium]
RDLLRTHVPEVDAHTVHELTGSPRTFERFTRRHQGFVGGVPRDAYLAMMRRLTVSRSTSLRSKLMRVCIAIQHSLPLSSCA